MYSTVGPAVACHLEAQVGVVMPGMLADLVLLKRDPTVVEPEDLLDNEVSLTVIGGKVVWEG
jgi:predicted amidohydrolase YtcJ